MKKTHDLKYYKEKIRNKEIMKGNVKIVQKHETLDSDVVIVDLGGRKGIITREEIDYKLKLKSLTGFIGRLVHFVPIGIIEETGDILLSRKLAQELKEDEIIGRLIDGEVFDAQITHFVSYGAFVEIEGISGLLRNSDFSDDHTKIKDIRHIGDRIKVKLQHVSEDKERLSFEVLEKYENPTVMNLDNFERNQVVVGRIVTIKPWGVFVNIAPGLDALCNVPATIEIEEDLKVSFRIKKVIKDEGKVRGKIIRTL